MAHYTYRPTIAKRGKETMTVLYAIFLYCNSVVALIPLKKAFYVTKGDII